MRYWFWLILAVVLSAETLSQAGDWPAWRGPEGTGVAPGETLPLRWSTNDNVRWKAALPERGNSTPIVWKERIFLSNEARRQKRHKKVYSISLSPL